jgi:uncharacterized pyridoxamine 5'-phosphate oxidase family protein
MLVKKYFLWREIMNEALKFLIDNQTFYIATVDGDEPKVRPFGFVMEFDQKIYFCTNNQKEVFKQLKANPKFEVCTADKTGLWIRLRGKAVFDNNIAAKEKVLELRPSLAERYQNASNPIFEVFYVSEGEAAIFSITGEKKTYKL